MIHFTNRRKLVYYDGNYDQFVKTKTEKEENQWKQYRWEQEQIKSMKEYIARFGHGTAKNAKQAQSKEKVLQKMIRAGLTEKPEEEKPLNFKFNDPGHLPPPVLAFHDVSFGYPGCDPLYTNVNFGVDLDSRVALGKFTIDVHGDGCFLSFPLSSQRVSSLFSSTKYFEVLRVRPSRPARNLGEENILGKLIDQIGSPSPFSLFSSSKYFLSLACAALKACETSR